MIDCWSCSYIYTVVGYILAESLHTYHPHIFGWFSVFCVCFSVFVYHHLRLMLICWKKNLLSWHFFYYIKTHTLPAPHNTKTIPNLNITRSLNLLSLESWKLTWSVRDYIMNSHNKLTVGEVELFLLFSLLFSISSTFFFVFDWILLLYDDDNEDDENTKTNKLDSFCSNSNARGVMVLLLLWWLWWISIGLNKRGQSSLLLLYTGNVQKKERK